MFQIPKRELTLVDRSGFSVRMTLWGKQAEQYNVEDSPVIAFKGVRVGDFGGKEFYASHHYLFDLYYLTSRSFAVDVQLEYYASQPRY